MLMKRVIVCLDVKNRRVTKGVRFKNNVDVGDVVSLADKYCREGADELVFYDIMASAEQRPIDLEMVASAARKVFIPFCVGGGIRSSKDMREALLAGADKVSLNSLAVQQPSILTESANAFGRQCVGPGAGRKTRRPLLRVSLRLPGIHQRIPHAHLLGCGGVGKTRGGTGGRGNLPQRHRHGRSPERLRAGNHAQGG